MADIFLSYAREDVEKARQVADALTHEGWTVWWDPKIPTGTEWERVLLPELERARCVVVLWSSHSVQSDWVRKEADAAAERTVLVPALIEIVPIPATTLSIQVANLTKWSGNPATPRFKEFLNAVRDRMLPTCEIRFRSLLDPEPETVQSVMRTLVQVAGRVIPAPRVGVFSEPESPADQRRLERTIASIIVTVHWPPALTELFDTAIDQDLLAERLARIPRRIPVLWLDQVSYAGPFQSLGPPLRTHQNYLAFASLWLYHSLFISAQQSGRHVDAQYPLTTQLLSYPRWEGAISVFFEAKDAVALAYVTSLDDQYLRPEVVVYGPSQLSLEAYRMSLRREIYTNPVWLEQYFIPQYELLLAIEQPDRMVSYQGNAYIRKVTDLKGKDLPLLRLHPS